MKSLDDVWREMVCDKCHQCKRKLSFMEGPYCDRCIDESELVPPGSHRLQLYTDPDPDEIDEPNVVSDDVSDFPDSPAWLEIDLEFKRFLKP